MEAKEELGKYEGINLAFNQYGEFNKNLSDIEMIKAFFEIMNDEDFVPPEKK